MSRKQKFYILTMKIILAFIIILSISSSQINRFDLIFFFAIIFNNITVCTIFTLFLAFLILLCAGGEGNLSESKGRWKFLDVPPMQNANKCRTPD